MIADERGWGYQMWWLWVIDLWECFPCRFYYKNYIFLLIQTLNITRALIRECSLRSRIKHVFKCKRGPLNDSFIMRISAFWIWHFSMCISLLWSWRRLSSSLLVFLIRKIYFFLFRTNAGTLTIQKVSWGKLSKLPIENLNRPRCYILLEEYKMGCSDSKETELPKTNGDSLAKHKNKYYSE